MTATIERRAMEPQMVDPLRKFRVDAPIDRLQTVPGGAALFVESAARVYELGAAAIDHVLATGELALDKTPGCRKLCDEVSAWTVDARVNAFLGCGKTEWQLLSLANGSVLARHRLPREMGAACGVALGSGELVAMWGPPAKSSERDPDPNELHLVVQKSGEVSAARVLSLPGRMSVHWSQKSLEFVVVDLRNQQVFRVGTKGRVTPLACGFLDEDTAIGASFIDEERGLILHVIKDDAPSRLFAGVLSADGVRWGGAVTMPEGSWDHLCWNSMERLWAGERMVGRRSSLTVLDERGKVQMEQGLLEDCVLSDLVWSGTGRRLYAAVDEAMMVWNL